MNARYGDGTVAFVFKQDRRKIIHLTEHFFNPGLDVYTPLLPPRFNVDSHARAVALIHEFSHLFCDSEDLASVESMAPYPHLINTATAVGQLLKDDLERLRKSFSPSTTPSRLFTEETANGAWIDLDHVPSRVDDYKKILDLTKCKNLADARKAFCSTDSAEARIDLMMANADSIALLVSEMGRVLDPPPAPPLPVQAPSQTGSVQTLP